MIGVDTNVLLRFLVVDQPEQNRTATAFFSSRTPDNPAFVSAVTLAETVWLLTKRLHFPAESVVDLLRNLLASEAIVLEHEMELDRILRDGGRPRTDLADYLIAWSGLSAGCRHTVTFDRQAAKEVTGMELLT
ncbi:MAG: type II toxin-antitoxin system VapC family toxin [Rhizobiaceae bacterium]|nr:type II toxin-antitoxin system VapC family toxin [Rhizobiaceae bacterium]